MTTSIIIGNAYPKKVYDLVTHKHSYGYQVYLERHKNDPIYIGFVSKTNRRWDAHIAHAMPNNNKGIEGFISKYYACWYLAMEYKRINNL